MIRVIQRRLIIPRGDTGIFTIPAMTQAEGAIGVFTIFDPITNTRIFQKQVEIEGENFNIGFSHADTVNLKAGEYLWDIKFYKNPILADNKVIDGEEINSYYAAFQAPKCEIRETGDDFLMIEGQPAKIEDLNIILAATEAANAAKVAAIEQADIAAEKAEEAAAKLAELVAAMPTKVSELENDSGYLQQETDPTVPAWAKAQTKPTYTAQEVGALPADTFIPTVPTNVSAFTNDAGYLTAHQDISMKANSADLAAVATSGSYNDLENKPFIPSKVSDLTDDSGHYTKPAGGIPASDLAEEYLTAHQDISGKANKSEIPTKVSQLQNDSGYLTSFTETDPTVPSWAKAAQKPTYTAAEVGAPTVQEMNTAIGNAIGNINSFDMAVVQALPTEDISTHTIYLVPKTGETNDVYDEYVYINDAWEMVGNTQIDLSNYVTFNDIATRDNAGVAKYKNEYGLYITNDNYAAVYYAPQSAIKRGTEEYRPIVPANQHQSIFYGLAKAAGDTTQSTSSNAIGTYTTEAKAAIRSMIGAAASADLTVQDVQINGTSIVENGVANIPKANASTFGVVLPHQNSFDYYQGALRPRAASASDIKTGTDSWHMLTSFTIQNSTFYGLAKAAGDTTQSQSDNAVGTYTDEAKVAIQQMLDVPSNSDVSIYATKADTVLETSLSRGRKSETAIGLGSLAFGNDVEASSTYTMAFGYKTSATGPNSYSEGNQTLASGNAAHAEGFKSIANGAGSHAEGSNTIANAAYSHVEGKYNIEDSIQSWPTWTPNTEYIVGDKVKMLVVNLNNETSFNGYICKTANNDAEFVTANWTKTTFMNYARIIGNGTADNARSNAYALDWSGNGHYMGNIYVGANADSTGGTKVLCEADFATDLDIQNIINGGAGA